MQYVGKMVAQSYMGKLKKEFMDDEDDNKPTYRIPADEPRREIVSAKEKREFENNL
jgi:hypothetical protein